MQDVSVSFHLLEFDIHHSISCQYLMNLIAQLHCPTLLLNTISQKQSLATSQTTHPHLSVALRKPKTLIALISSDASAVDICVERSR